MIRGRVARPRITTLPLTGAPPFKILEAHPQRVGLSFVNDSAATVYLTADPSETNPDLMFALPGGASFTVGQAPFTPANALYASADAGHSLRVWELIEEQAEAPRPARRPWSLFRAILLLLLLSAGPAHAQIFIPGPGCGNCLPPQIGHAGQFLTTDGTVASWGTPAGGGGTIPAGVIVMWSGTLASVPAGWKLCDGTLGTPDLRNRFIYGWTAAVDPGSTGGSTSYTPAGTNSAPALTMNSYTPAGTNSAPTFTGSALATHAHELPMWDDNAGEINIIPRSVFGTGTSRAGNLSICTAGLPCTSNTASHAVDLSQAVSAGTPAGTVSAPTFTGTAATLTGSVAAPTFTGTAATIIMPYFQLAYLMKS